MGWYSGRHRGDAEKKTGLYPHGPHSPERETQEPNTFFKVIRASQVAQAVKNLPAIWETGCSIPGLGRSPGKGNGYPLQYSRLEKPMDRGSWWATVYGVAKS